MEEVERQELRQASPELRWRQLNAVYGLGLALGWLATDDPLEEERIWERWQRLRGLR